jgi:hypothetical protein
LSRDDPASPQGVLSLEGSVKHYLDSAECRYKLKLDLTPLRKACKRALNRITPLATKQGRKADVNLHLFAESLFHVARLCGARTTLPSGQIKERNGPTKRTKFFDFARATLELTIKKGCVAIKQADLSEAEKGAALKVLGRANKTDSALLEVLRNARKNVARAS